MEPEKRVPRSVEYREPLGNGHTLLLRRDALSLGTDALLLAGILPTRPDDFALEIGAGTGAVSLLAALRGKFARIDAVEIQPALAALARRNVTENGLDGKMRIIEADARALPPSHAYHAVFMNPPYRAAGSGQPCKSIAADFSRYERAGTIAELCRAAAGCLRPNGRLYAVWPAARLPALLSALREAELSSRRLTEVRAYPGASPSLCLCTAVAGVPEKTQNTGTIFTPTLFLRTQKDSREDSPAVRILSLTGSLPGEWSRYD